MRRWLFGVLVLGAVWAGVIAAQRQLAGLPLAPTPSAMIASLRQSTGTDRSANQSARLNRSGLTNLPILMYHHIQTLSTDRVGTIDWGLSISEAAFEQQLDWLSSQGYQTVSLANALAGKLPDKPIILTFDDGYEDFYTNAWPLLQQRGFTATLYVIIDRLGASGFLTKDQLLNLANGGVEIGSHTVSHPNLSKMSGSKLAAELVDSRVYLRRLTGQDVVSLCYPSGQYSEATEVAAEAAGYTTAVTTVEGFSDWRQPYALSRLRIKPSIDQPGFAELLGAQSK